MRTHETDCRATVVPERRPLPDSQHLLELLTTLVGSTFRQILWRKAAELELTFSQSMVLFYVEQHPGCSMGEVAKAIDVTLPAITQVVDRLEQRAFLTRGSDPTDRRVSTLQLTAAGKDLAKELQILQIESLESVLARISPRDRHRVVKGLEVLVQAATQGRAEVRGRGR